MVHDGSANSQDKKYTMKLWSVLKLKKKYESKL